MRISILHIKILLKVKIEVKLVKVRINSENFQEIMVKLFFETILINVLKVWWIFLSLWGICYVIQILWVKDEGKSYDFCYKSRFCKSVNLEYVYSNRKNTYMYKKRLFLCCDYHVCNNFKSERVNQKHAAEKKRKIETWNWNSENW